jgi:hypothetical protein
MSNKLGLVPPPLLNTMLIEVLADIDADYSDFAIELL